MFHKVIKTIIAIIVALIIILLLAYGISKSDFSKIKKYDEKDGSPRSHIAPSKEKKRIAEERYYTTKVRIKDGEMANLGDFTLNISGNKKLTANISLKYKDNKGNDWMSGKSVSKEIVAKGDILRSAVIHTLSGNADASISNNLMKKELVNNINNYLSDGEVEEVYFNKFIIQ